MTRNVFRLAAAAALGFASVVAQAVPVTYSARLDGPSESPPVASPATGTATVVFDADADLLRVQTAFDGLVGTTTAAHIHCCTSTPLSDIAGVATQVPSFVGFPLGVTSGVYSQDFDLGDLASWNPAFVSANGGTAAGAEAALGAGLEQGRAYLNIHSTFSLSGEIRGFLVAATAVPEPGTLGLIGAALVAAGAARRGLTRRSSHAPR